MKVWKIAIIAKANHILDLYLTSVDEEDGEWEDHTQNFAPGGGFDTIVYQVNKYSSDKEFYSAVSRIHKKGFDDIKLSRDAKDNLKPFVFKGRKLFPEFYI